MMKKSVEGTSQKYFLKFLVLTCISNYKSEFWKKLGFSTCKVKVEISARGIWLWLRKRNSMDCTLLKWYIKVFIAYM